MEIIDIALTLSVSAGAFFVGYCVRGWLRDESAVEARAEIPRRTPYEPPRPMRDL